MFMIICITDKCATIDLSKTCPTERIDSKHELALRNIFFKLGKTEEQASISAEVSTSSDVFCGYSTSKACKEGISHFIDQLPNNGYIQVQGQLRK